MVLLIEDGYNKELRYYYECPNHKNKVCKTKSLNADYIENVVLDLVVDIINSLDLSNELNNRNKERIAFHSGIVSKNKRILNEKTKALDALAIQVSKINNSLLIDTMIKRMESLAEEINSYEKKIEEHSVLIEEISETDVMVKITKEELLNDRKLAQSIIREVIDEIIVDDENDDITVKTK